MRAALLPLASVALAHCTPDPSQTRTNAPLIVTVPPATAPARASTAPDARTAESDDHDDAPIVEPSRQPAPPIDTEAATLGQQLYQSQGCFVCHSVDGSQLVGPTWLGLYGKSESLADGTRVEVDDAYLSDAILDPSAHLVTGYPPAMPNYAPFLRRDQVDAIIEYIKSLR